MAHHLKQTFESKRALSMPVFVTFVTAGFPRPDMTVDVMLAMEAGGADVIELGVPFSDPIADGPAIQQSNVVALEQNVDLPMVLSFVKEARAKGLKAPVLLMGYYNPMRAYGEREAVRDAREYGANGFIMVDLPPEEAIKFREICTEEGMSYVPLIAPSTTDKRIAFLGGIADSFIYVVSKMGTTGASSTVSTALPELLNRIKSNLPNPNTPLAVGFGVSTAEHFVQIGEEADGVVIGSKLVQILEKAEKGKECEELRKFCEEVGGGGQRKARAKALGNGHDAPVKTNGNGHAGLTAEVDVVERAKEEANGLPAHIVPIVETIDNGPLPGTADSQESAPIKQLPARFGEFGGQYVPEALFDCLVELEAAHRSAMADPSFWAEYESYFPYINRPSELYLAERLTEFAGGAKIWMKREDLNHTGSHKINNAIGQILLAKRLGKKRIIAETGAGQHGVATATACAKFGLECIVYMGAEDVRRQALNVFRMKLLGAKVVSVASGSKTLKDAINEAMREWVSHLDTTHYLVGSAIGPHPFPTIVRDFQSVIGKEIKSQLRDRLGKLPDAVVACVGGGSNAIGTFHPFIEDQSVRLIGVEAGGSGVDTPYHSATLAKGTVGVLHGVKTYLLQTPSGQITETHSISAGLDYPGVGPEHAWLKDSGRAEYVVATDEDALRGFRMCSEKEGIIPALETAHAIWATVQLAKELPKDQNIVMCLSGRGDKDVEQIAEVLPKWAEKLDWHLVQ